MTTFTCQRIKNAENFQQQLLEQQNNFLNKEWVLMRNISFRAKKDMLKGKLRRVGLGGVNLVPFQQKVKECSYNCWLNLISIHYLNVYAIHIYRYAHADSK